MFPVNISRETSRRISHPCSSGMADETSNRLPRTPIPHYHFDFHSNAHLLLKPSASRFVYSFLVRFNPSTQIRKWLEVIAVVNLYIGFND
jgi:hypothetical protein